MKNEGLPNRGLQAAEENVVLKAYRLWSVGEKRPKKRRRAQNSVDPELLICPYRRNDTEDKKVGKIIYFFSKKKPKIRYKFQYLVGTAI